MARPLASIDSDGRTRCTRRGQGIRDPGCTGCQNTAGAAARPTHDDRNVGQAPMKLVDRRTFARTAAAALFRRANAAPPHPAFILDPESFRHHVDFFNRMAPEDVVNFIPNAEAWPWMKRNVPLFACPDRDVEQIYYFRWWVFRKHIKHTPAGFLVTEFLKPVKHAGPYNSLSCAFGHHVAEGRWLHEPRYVDQDIHYWLRGGENGGLAKN